MTINVRMILRIIHMHNLDLDAEKHKTVWRIYSPKKYGCNYLTLQSVVTLVIQKFWPDFENLKCNNFLSVIQIVSKMSSYMQKSMRNVIKLTDFVQWKLRQMATYSSVFDSLPKFYTYKNLAVMDICGQNLLIIKVLHIYFFYQTIKLLHNNTIIMAAREWVEWDVGQ